jgi:hypothetical protein
MEEKIAWSALEYEEKERHPDWFWALGVIIFASSVTSIIFGNYFFAILLIVGGLLLGFFAIKKPDLIFYELNEKGLQIKDRIYPFENIKSFWVQKEKTPTLFIRSERLLLPIISVPIEENLIEKIHSLMLVKNIPEEEMKEHPSEKIMESLGF